MKSLVIEETEVFIMNILGFVLYGVVLMLTVVFFILIPAYFLIMLVLEVIETYKYDRRAKRK